MAQIISRFVAALAAVATPVALEIPRGSTELSIRVDRDEPVDSPINVIVTVLAADPPADPPDNYERVFELNEDGTPVPDTFKKYLGTVPFGPLKVETHIIEVTPAAASA